MQEPHNSSRYEAMFSGSVSDAVSAQHAPPYSHGEALADGSAENYQLYEDGRWGSSRIQMASSPHLNHHLLYKPNSVQQIPMFSVPLLTAKTGR